MILELGLLKLILMIFILLFIMGSVTIFAAIKTKDRYLVPLIAISGAIMVILAVFGIVKTLSFISF